MRRYGVLALALLAAPACDDNPTEPSDTPGGIVFTAQLSAANEVPPISNAESGARGDVRVTFNVTQDNAGAITGGTAVFVINLNSFPANTNAIAAHIHEGASGIAGGVRIGVTAISGSTPVTMASGSASSATFSETLDTATELQHANAMLTNPGGYYFNVHTPLNPGGAVRGQMVRQ
jgi:hypothetical protein